MYEQVSHSLLNEILIKLNPEIKQQELRHFYTRLGANFYSIYTLFHVLASAKIFPSRHYIWLKPWLDNILNARKNSKEKILNGKKIITGFLVNNGLEWPCTRTALPKICKG